MASARYQPLNDMRGLDDSTDVLIRVSQTATEQVRHGWRAFVNFAARDNVLEVALGLMSGNSTRPQLQ
jgi:large conductance mechanosensitive channel